MKVRNVLFLTLLFIGCTEAVNNSQFQATDSQRNWCVAKADIIERNLIESYKFEYQKIVVKTNQWKQNTDKEIKETFYNFESSIGIFVSTRLKENYPNINIDSLNTRKWLFFNGDQERTKQTINRFHKNYDDYKIMGRDASGAIVEMSATNSKENSTWAMKTYIAFYSYLLKTDLGNNNALEICKIWADTADID